jgi:hypothetical protein
MKRKLKIVSKSTLLNVKLISPNLYIPNPLNQNYFMFKKRGATDFSGIGIIAELLHYRGQLQSKLLHHRIKENRVDKQFDTNQ